MSSERCILILKLGDTVPSVSARRGDFDQWIAAGLGLPESRLRCLQLHRGEALPEPESVDAVVLSGSSAMVTQRHAWSEEASHWLVPVVNAGTPVLGICYGHQLMAKAFGGEVGDNPRGREIGTVTVDRSGGEDDALFEGFPDRFEMQASHMQSVLRLPDGAVRLATTQLDPHHAFRLGEKAWGVQFHPEFDADIIRGYLDERRDVLSEEGLEADALAEAAGDSEFGTRLLRRFGEIVDA